MSTLELDEDCLARLDRFHTLTSYSLGPKRMSELFRTGLLKVALYVSESPPNSSS